MSRKTLSNEEASQLVSNWGYELITQGFIKDKQKIILKDDFGYLYVTILNNLKHNYIPRFAHKSNSYSIDNIKLWCKLNKKPFELLDGQKYSVGSKNLKWKCSKETCGEVFEATWQCISIGRGCPFCHGRQVGLSNCLATKNPKLVSEWHPTKNGDLTPYNITQNSTKKVWWICKECNHEWFVSPNARNRNNTGCPKCNESKGENKISQVLTYNSIYYIPQHIFKDCKYRNSLRFDFFIPNLNICIEFQGEQHYRAVKFFRGDKNFKTQQKIDQIKRDYCKNNNIILLEIPYWDFDKIEEILEHELNF